MRLSEHQSRIDPWLHANLKSVWDKSGAVN